MEISGDVMVYTGKWEKKEDYNKIDKFEAQVWFGLRELLLNPKCAPYYDITEFRMAQLTKVFIKIFNFLLQFKKKLFITVAEVHTGTCS